MDSKELFVKVLEQKIKKAIYSENPDKGVRVYIWGDISKLESLFLWLRDILFLKCL